MGSTGRARAFGDEIAVGTAAYQGPWEGQGSVVRGKQAPLSSHSNPLRRHAIRLQYAPPPHHYQHEGAASPRTSHLL